MTKYMANNVPGVIIPEDIIKRMAGVPKEKAAEEGIKICVEQIQELREIKGVHGIHLMAIEWESRVPEIVSQAKLCRGRLCNHTNFLPTATGVSLTILIGPYFTALNESRIIHKRKC
jgi:hypothetical protein